MGKVVFIGAGPGDPELLTIKASKVLNEAHVVIYAGSLVNPELLQYTGEDAVIFNSATMTLPEIVEVMRDYAVDGKLVARVHTGDPSIYGAIGEQIKYLDKFRVPYEIIPGVSSFSAAAAALHAELTLPMLSQTVIITRPEGRTPKPKGEGLSELAMHGSTMCIFLGVQMIDKVVKDLLESYPSDTPVGVVSKASWSDQQIIRGTLNDIVDKVEESDIRKTALIIVGRVLDPSVIVESKLYDEEFSHMYRKGKE